MKLVEFRFGKLTGREFTPEELMAHLRDLKAQREERKQKKVEVNE